MASSSRFLDPCVPCHNQGFQPQEWSLEKGMSEDHNNEK